MNFKSFFAELKRRNVYKVAAGYAVTSSLLLRMAFLLLATFEPPHWVMKVFGVALALHFPARWSCRGHSNYT